MGKAFSSVVLYFQTAVTPGAIRMRHKIFRTTEYDWDRGKVNITRGETEEMGSYNSNNNSNNSNNISLQITTNNTGLFPRVVIFYQETFDLHNL